MKNTSRPLRASRNEADDLVKWLRLTPRQRRQPYWQQRQRGWQRAALIFALAGIEPPPLAARWLGLPPRAPWNTTSWGSPWPRPKAMPLGEIGRALGSEIGALPSRRTE
jgi:hypothetical protein